jgi:hypothetical protein
MADRILPISSIPNVLWQDGSLLRLSANLAQSYRLTLQANGWLEEALAATAQGDVGGESEAEASS